MQNFNFYSPTKVIFGSDILKDLGKTAGEHGTKALLVYGRNSIKESGLYDQIVTLLEDDGISVTDHPGVKPNPELSHAREGAKKAVDTGAEMIIAVGGGSVIDESKAIAAGACYKGNLWDFYIHKATVKAALPVIAVQTLPATSSETNQVSVLTNPETNEKFGLRSPLIIPRTAFLDPSLTFTIPMGIHSVCQF